MTYSCPVCGYPNLKEKPRTGNGGSYEICPSCGFQFGVTDDDDEISYEAWRRKWKRNGMKWSSASGPPKNWNPIKQLAKLERSGKIKS